MTADARTVAVLRARLQHLTESEASRLLAEIQRTPEAGRDLQLAASLVARERGLSLPTGGNADGED